MSRFGRRSPLIPPLEMAQNAKSRAAAPSLGKKLSRDFFARSVHEVAPDLIGATFLVGGVGGIIVELEAYHHTEPAAHSFNGPTPRYQVMFATPMLGLEASPASIEMAAASFTCVCTKAQRCLDAGVLGGYEAHEIAASVWATAHGLVSLDLLGRRPPVLADDQPFERTIRALLRGFAPF